MGRWFLSVLLILTVLVTLSTGCAGSPTSTRTLNVGNINVDTNKNGLDLGQMKAVANMMADAYSAGFESFETLVAASRGYDMTAENFDASKEEYPDLGINMEYVKNVLRTANQKAEGKSNVLPSDSLEDYLGKMNEADVNTLIEAFQVKVDTSSSGGFLDKILCGIGIALRWITDIFGGNYIVGICIFAIIIEILMLPFGIKQQKNSIRQAKLRPKEMAIRNKYKGRNDQPTMQKMQAEIQELYQRENFSPYSGCLPLLIQLPIIMALYYIVIDPLHYMLGQASGMSSALALFTSTSKAAGGLGFSIQSQRGTIEMLSHIKSGGVELLEGIKSFRMFSNGDEVYNALGDSIKSIPDFNIGSVNFGVNPTFDFSSIQWVLLFVPVLTFVTYFITAKLNRKLMYQPATNGGADARQIACSNTMMDITMPLMSTVFTMAVPGVIGIYWAFRSWVGLLKSFILARIMPLPTFTEEDYKAAAKEMTGRKQIQKSDRVGTVRSLHHIDDEDYADTRDRALARKAAIEAREKEGQAGKSQETPLDAVPLKEDKKKEKSRNAQPETATEEPAKEQSGNETDSATENDNDIEKKDGKEQ